MITSAHNPKLKLIRSLSSRAKERKEAGLFFIEGVRLVEEALDSNFEIDFVLYSSEASNKAQKVIGRIIAEGIDAEEVNGSVFRTISETETSQGLLAVVHFLPSKPEIDLKDNLILIPDQIRDPGNLGTLLRSAVAAGVQHVFIPPETTDPFGPKVLRSGMGAHFKLKITSMIWEEIAQKLNGFIVFLASADGELVYWQANFKQPMAIIIGGEADGAGVQAMNLANHKLNIPMNGKIESLNAGVAGSVILFEVLRQRSVS
jgi:TrmH family RNA methyltransferase